MKLLFSLLLSLLAMLFYNGDIAMLGIKIHDPKSALDKIKLSVVAKDENMVKYRTANGDDLAITVKKGKVVYMENDWLHKPGGKQPLFSDFTFGETSLRDIRKKFGTNGFIHTAASGGQTGTDLVQFNCFEFDSPNDEVLVTITKVSLNAKVTEQNISDSLKLDALIIADKKYLDELWGKAKSYDPNYKKI